MTLEADKRLEVEQENILLSTINETLENTLHDLRSIRNDDELKNPNVFLDQVNDFILENKQESINNIFSIISHELRTPLVPIKAYVKMILEGKFGTLNEQQMAKLDTVTENISTLEKIIDRSLSLKKIEEGSFSICLEKTSLKQIFQDSIKNLQAQLTSKQISLVMPERDHIITCDKRLILAIFEEILRNAITAIGGVGQITLSADQTSAETTIKITDTGHGIAENKIQGVFARMHQIDMSNTRPHGGLGIGLYYCKKIIDAHNGSIAIQSKENQGTEITLTLKN
jgi:signal transduction histidine kinase